MQMKQVNISYAPIEDRLLLRISTTDEAELRLWITRAVAIKMMPDLLNAEKQLLVPAVQHIANPAVRGTVEQFYAEEARNQNDFSSQFTAKASSFPLGEQPVLVSRLDITVHTEDASLAFTLVNNRLMTISFNIQILTGVNKLIRNVVDGANWHVGIETIKHPLIQMPESETWH